MWGAGAPLHAQSIISLIRAGPTDCLLVSSQCGGWVASHSLLLALHSPLLARILGQVGQGAAGLTLPLPLKTIQGLVALLQGEAGKVEEEVKEAVDILGMGVQEECDRQATSEEELLSYWEDDSDNIIISQESTQCENKSFDNSEDEGEYNVLEDLKEAASDLGMGLQEEPLSMVGCATLEEELPGKLEYFSENTVKSNENMKCAYKPLSNTKNGGEYNVLGEVKVGVHILGMRAKEECDRLLRGATLPEDLQSEWEEGPENMQMYREDSNCEDGEENSALEKGKFKCSSQEHLGSLISEETMEMKNDSLNFRKREQKKEIFPTRPHSLQNKLICNFCTKNFKRKRSLKKHIWNIHEKLKKPASCPYCLEQFSLLAFPNHHKKCRRSYFKPKYDHELQSSICESCDKTFLNRTKLKAHIKRNHEGRPKTKPERTSCNVCNRSFNNKYYLEKHIIFEHKNTVAKFVLCSVCDKGFPIISIASHKRKCKMSDKEKEEYKEKNKAVCQECGKTLSCNQKLARHIANVHNQAINY